MNRRLALLSLVAVAALAAACAAKPERRYDRDPAADWPSYRTFAFQEARDPARTARGGYTTLQEMRLQQSAREQLERQGLVQVAGDPDLRVHLMLKVERKQELHGTSSGRGLLPHVGWGTQIDTVEVQQGTLVIDLVDARRNALVWRGVAEGRIDSADAKDPGAAIERAVAEVFTGFKR